MFGRKRSKKKKSAKPQAAGAGPAAKPAAKTPPAKPSAAKQAKPPAPGPAVKPAAGKKAAVPKVYMTRPIIQKKLLRHAKRQRGIKDSSSILSFSYFVGFITLMGIISMS